MGLSGLSVVTDSLRVVGGVDRDGEGLEHDSSSTKSSLNLASKFYAVASAAVIGASALTGSFAAVAMATGGMACPLLLAGAAMLPGKIADYKDKRDAKTIDAYLKQKQELGLNGVEAASPAQHCLAPGKVGL